jgi:helicase MOV-10
MKSKRHLKLSSGGTAVVQFLFCNLCDRCISGANSWRAHLRSKKHVNKAAQQHVSPNIEPEVPSSVPGHQFCIVCRLQVANHVWSGHCASNRHIAKAKYATFRSALEEAEEDKNGAAILGDFDFKVVEKPAAAQGISVTGKIESNEPRCSFTLLEYTLASTKGQATYSP